ncbi:MAG: tRNA 2-thiouridine(34) synthase MnmA [Gammaproteobacteria bacterium]
MKVIVGLSGGVDSSVTAMLLKQQGYEVEALFMKNWNETGTNGNCMWEGDVEDAMRVCERLQIPLNTVDLSSEYWDSVFSNFLDEYRNGRTPNPDVLCNQEVKFRAFLDEALKLGADRIATGHYARIDCSDGRYILKKGVDGNKDQSYFLCRLTQKQLSLSLFPLGEWSKSRVRDTARQAGLVTHDKKDSTGICFIGEQSFRDFLGRYIPPQKGEIRTSDGRLVGEHDGVIFYTLGQRRGLGIGGVQGYPDEPWYVFDKDLVKNILYVAQGHDNPLLFSHGLLMSGMHWIADAPPALPGRYAAKTRYRQADQSCRVEETEGSAYRLLFDSAQRAVTPGQYSVLYDDDICLGGGVIESTFR